MMKPMTRHLPIGPKWASQQFHQLYYQHYSEASIPGQSSKAYWPRHYSTINKLAGILGGYEATVHFFTWWFNVIGPNEKRRLTDPSGLWPWLTRFQVWYKCNKTIVDQLGGVENALTYLDSIP